MKAIVQSGYGHPERVLHLGEQSRPEPGADQVLVRVRATSVNTPDWIATLGVPYLLRPFLSGLLSPWTAVRGSDVAGVVEAVGPGVTHLAPGDEVFGSTWAGSLRRTHGTFCEHTVAPANQLALKPARLSFEEAAGSVMSGLTALLGIRDVGAVGEGTTVLINGASGGVGTFMVQIAKALGATVTGVCSTRNVSLVRELGADHVIDYTQEDFTRGEARYDLVVDNVLDRRGSRTARALAPGGRFIPNSVGTNRWVGSVPTMLFAALFRSRRWPTIHVSYEREHLESLAAMIDSGAVRVAIEEVYPLSRAGAAVAHMMSHRARGKLVISVPA